MNILVSFLVGDSSVTIRATEIIASSDKKTIYIYENHGQDHIAVLNIENIRAWDDYIQFLKDPMRNKGCFEFDIYQRKF